MPRLGSDLRPVFQTRSGTVTNLPTVIGCTRARFQCTPAWFDMAGAKLSFVARFNGSNNMCKVNFLSIQFVLKWFPVSSDHLLSTSC